VVLSQGDKNAGGLASVGNKSAKARMTASTTNTNGSIRIQNFTPTIPVTVAGARFSANIWATALVVSGTAVIANIDVFLIWMTGSTEVGSVKVGTMSAAGGSMQGKSIAVPAGIDKMQLRAQVNLTSWSTGAIIDAYADAVAITVP
jgi:hypothetical protein